MQQIINILRFLSITCLLIVVLSSFSRFRENQKQLTDKTNLNNSICDTLLIYDLYRPHTGWNIEKNSFFDADKIEILKKKMKEIINQTNNSIIIEYHTDVRGSTDANMTFSVNVLNELQKELNSDFNQSDLTRVSFIPMGETHPLISESELKKITDKIERESKAQKNKRFVVYCGGLN